MGYRGSWGRDGGGRVNIENGDRVSGGYIMVVCAFLHWSIESFGTMFASDEWGKGCINAGTHHVTLLSRATSVCTFVCVFFFFFFFIIAVFFLIRKKVSSTSYNRSKFKIQNQRLSFAISSVQPITINMPFSSDWRYDVLRSCLRTSSNKASKAVSSVLPLLPTRSVVCPS